MWEDNMRCLKIVLVMLMSFFSVLANAQVTKVRGKVTDAVSGDPMPFVGVTFTGTTIGTTTDLDGNYAIETREPVTEIMAMFVSYEEQVVKVQSGAFNTIDFKLNPIVNEVDAIVVLPGENPALPILKNVSKHKKYNNPDEMEAYNYTTYTKMEMDLANMKPEFKNKKLQKNFGFVFEYMDTSVVTGNSYLPVMITESTSDYYYRKTPKMSREVVKASRISGIEDNYTLAQFTGNMHVNVNLYNNYINIFEVNFASPLSDHGTMFYKYFLVDSVQMDNRKIYKIRFHPKSKAHPVFDGEVNIDSLTWALESASMRMIKGLNINWIRDLSIETRSQLVNDSTWFVKQDKLMADFSIQMKDSSKWVSVMGQRQIDYSNVRLGEEIPPDIAKLSTDVVIKDNVLINDEEYWKDLRPYELSEREKNIYGMVDSIKNVPLFTTIYDMIDMVLFGYLKTGKVELGPYYKLYSYNKFEGHRFHMGVRTNTDFSRKVRLGGYVAYGTKDDEFKGGGSVEYMFNRNLTSKLTVSGKHDVLQLGLSENAFASDNIMSTVLSRGNNDKMTLINQYAAKWEKEWVDGISNTFGFAYKEMFSNPVIDFTRPDGTKVKKVSSSEFAIGTRLSKSEIVVRRSFDKTYMGSDYPIVGIDIAGAAKNVLNNDYKYLKTELLLKYNLNINPLGRSEWTITGGKIFGKVPYPLLKLHEGNATYFYDPTAFSCMDFYEFASDLWGSVLWEHHFKGLFLGKIPLMKKLKWREVFTVKALWGKLSDKNNGGLAGSNAVFMFPEGMSAVSKPYIEAGFGIENIFRIVRVDAIWRLTHRDGRKASDNFAMNVSLHLKF